MFRTNCYGFIKLDPFYYIFELILPSVYERSLHLILTIPLIRIFLLFVCTFEFARFMAIILFTCLIIVFTMISCLHQVVQQSHKSEHQTIQHYSQLRILCNSCDYFLRHLTLFMISCSQVIIICMCWAIVKCWDVLPFYMASIFVLTATGSAFGTLLLLPHAVEICIRSKVFVDENKTSYHTFNRYHKTRCFYLRWKSQRALAIRFGSQFNFNESTLRDYLQVLVTNLTNAIFLIHP